MPTFDRPRVLADPFGAFLKGRREAEQDEIALIEFQDRRRTRALQDEGLAFRNALDRELARDERILALETRDLANQSAALDLSLNSVFSPSERIQGLELGDARIDSTRATTANTRVRTVAQDIENTLDAQFGPEERGAALRALEANTAGTQARTVGTVQQNALDAQFGARERTVDLDASAALAEQRRRGPANTQTLSPATQQLLNSIAGTPAAPTATPVSPLQQFETALANGGSISAADVNTLSQQFAAAVEANPTSANSILAQYPNLAELLAATSR